MKAKLLSLFSALVLFSVSFVSCNKDKDSDPNSFLYATWEYQKYGVYDYTNHAEIEATTVSYWSDLTFKADGTGMEGDYDFTWKRNSKPDHFDMWEGEYKIISLSANELLILATPETNGGYDGNDNYVRGYKLVKKTVN